MQDFQQLRQFADLLDLHLGVATRKVILEGNERLSQGTDETVWLNWMSGVGKRLQQIGDENPNREILLKDWVQLSSLKDSKSDSR